jgi:malate dehydrogenase
MSKVTVVGAGNVGATCAEVVARKNFAQEVVLVDIKEGIAEGKALDMLQVGPIEGFESRIKGVTNDYAATANSDVVVVTSGAPRKPGMNREDLININAPIVASVVKSALQYSPNAVFVIVANPLDTMTYHALKATGLPSERVVGMAGILDTARFKASLAQEIGVSPQDISSIILGEHGDSMVVLPRYTTVAGIPVTEIYSPERVLEIAEASKKGGGFITKMLGTSAWYAPGAAAAQMAEAIVLNTQRVFSASAYLTGQYGQNDIYLGTPVVLGKGGVQRIIELQLTEAEKAQLAKSADQVRSVNAILPK